MLPVRRRQSARAAIEQRALASEFTPDECAARLSQITWLETGEDQPIAWPLPEGKAVYGWVSPEGFMIALAREHERSSLDLAWGSWFERDSVTLVALELLSLKAARPALLLLPAVGLAAVILFSLLAGDLLLEIVELAIAAAIVGALILAVVVIDERRSCAAHRQLFTLILKTLDAVEAPRSAIPADAPLFPLAPDRPEPPGPVPWRR